LTSPGVSRHNGDMLSMTGFGAAKSETKDANIEVNVRSVNGRFLEVRFHLPREYLFAESELKSILQKTLLRGTVDVFVSRRMKPGSSQHQVVLNQDLVRQYKQTLGQIAKLLKVKTQFSLEQFARLPEVLVTEIATAVSEEETEALYEAMLSAVKNCRRERAREGQEIARDLQLQLQELENLILQINGLREEANTMLQQKLNSRLQARFQNVELDPQRVAQEVVLQMDKSDINEELSRLQEHVRNYRALLGESGSLGKKLDFYTQELLREVNTMGSKSNLSKLTQNVIEAKTKIERLREQVQNVE